MNEQSPFQNAVKQQTTNDAAKSAVASFRKLASQLAQRSIQGNQLMRAQPDRLVSLIQPKHIGRLMMFFYDPKLKEKLPYYDRFPLVIPIQMYSDGFLGLNLHYLPPNFRAILMDTLYNGVYRNTQLNEKQRIRISYNIVMATSRNRFYVPCVKRYLYEHQRSRFLVIEPNDWNIALFLPTERFAKKSKQHVFEQSKQKIRQGH